MTMTPLLRPAAAALLALTAALLLACGGVGKGLIPASQAGPLQSDFEAVAQAAEAGNGSCAGTEEALGKTEKDFLGLSAGVDRGLRSRLQQGISNLRTRALAMCSQPAATATSTTPTTTPTTSTTPTQTNTTPPATTTPTHTTPSESGGTGAPEQGSGGEGAGKGKSKEGGEAGGKEEAGKGKAESESEATSGGASAPGGGQ